MPVATIPRRSPESGSRESFDEPLLQLTWQMTDRRTVQKRIVVVAGAIGVGLAIASYGRYRQEARKHEMVEALQRGTASWNKWRAEQGSACDLEMSGLDLVGVELSPTNFQRDLEPPGRPSDTYVPIQRSDIAYLSGVDLSFSNLAGADLRGASLSSATLRHVDLTGATLINAYLRKAHLTGARLSGARLDAADLQDADLRDSNLAGADLSGADLRNATLRGADIEKASFFYACLYEADLSGVVNWTTESLRQGCVTLAEPGQSRAGTTSPAALHRSTTWRESPIADLPDNEAGKTKLIRIERYRPAGTTG